MFFSVTMATVVALGECGKHATWSLDDNGTLLIEGTGALHHFYWWVKPWDKYYKDVKRVVINEGIKHVYPHIFGGLENLESIDLPSTLKTFSGDCLSPSSEKVMNISVHRDNHNFCSVDGILYDKDMTTLVKFPSGRGGEYIVPDGIKIIGEAAFFESQLKKITLAQSVRKIESKAFNHSQILYFNLPEKLEYIGSYAFSRTNAANIHLPSSVKTIKSCAFDNCKNLEEIVIDIESNKIPKEAFLYCSSLKSVKVIGKTKKICRRAFYGCVNLESVVLGDNMRKISKDAFDKCKKLKSVTIKESQGQVSP